MAELFTGAYEYDGAGNIAKIGVDAYTYDGVGRLTLATANRNFAGDRRREYQYDPFGNLTSITTKLNGSPSVRSIPVSSATNRLTGAAYDARGNVISPGAGQTHVYDALGTMARLEANGQAWKYVYTADGERIWMYNSAASLGVWTLRDLDGKVLRQWKETGTIDPWGNPSGAHTWTRDRDYLYRNGALLAEVTSSVSSSGTRYLHLDHLGTPRLVTSSTGSEEHTYWPFGEEITAPGDTASRLRFTGHERDYNGGWGLPGTGDLDYMHARHYSPVMGRFLSVDPADSGKPRRPQTWNRYSYAWNTPLTLVDPNGQEPIDPTIASFLGDYFGTNVSHVQVFGGPLARSLAFAFGLGRADAVTFGQRIFYRGGPWAQYKNKTAFGIALTGHEVRHTIDYQGLGFFGFIGQYLRQWTSVGFDYNKIPLELAAFADQEAIEKLLEDPDLLRSIQDGTYGHASMFKESPVSVGVMVG